MDNVEIKLHEFQKIILKKLAFQPLARFNDLLIDGLESEHMNYHLQKLIDFKLVAKSGDHYTLTDKGKDYSNLMDDQVELVEKQPKTSVLLHVVRKNSKTGEIDHLLSKRLRQPYYGKVGRLSGKVRFGETLEQAARRELLEETGLTPKEIFLEEIYHKLRYRPDGTFVQDVLFYIFFIREVSGKLITQTPFQENLWISKRKLESAKDVDLFDSLRLDDRLRPRDFKFTEEVGPADGY